MKEKYWTLCSQGCCGSNRMECLKKPELKLKRISLKVPKGQHNVHTKYPPRNFDICNVLYMYGDPRNILLSSIGKSKDNKFIRAHAMCAGGDFKYFEVPHKVTIKQLLEDMYDPLGLEEHFTNWLNADIDYELMMLKYEALENPKTFQKVLDFFEVEGNCNYGWRPRKSNYLNLPEIQQIQITKLFENLLKIQSKIPPVYIKHGKHKL